jgi:hypothetical protein
MRDLVLYQQIDRKKEEFRWRTMRGEVLTIPEMDTPHIFNCAKMCFNHLAEQHGGTPVQFTKKYSDYKRKAKKDPKGLATLAMAFCLEVLQRGDLPIEYREPFEQIIRQIFPLDQIQPALKELQERSVE